MTEKREFYAASVDEALGRAARDLGIEREDLSYRVVDEGNSGFLGIGARDARIEVDAPTQAAEAPEPNVPEALEVEPPPSEGAEEASFPQHIDGDAAPAPSASDEAEPVPEEAVEETESRIVSVLEAMGFNSRVDVYDAGGYVAVDVAPDNTALFIGQKGETIDALQYLINASVNRNRTSRVRIVLDAEGYRQRRVEALQGMAHRTARKVLREDRSVELPPMNPAERRVVHLFLKDNPRVTTESEGTGDSRRIRISPT